MKESLAWPCAIEDQPGCPSHEEKASELSRRVVCGMAEIRKYTGSLFWHSGCPQPTGRDVNPCKEGCYADPYKKP